MNLKFKLTHKVTAVIQIISNTQAIVSDECTPGYDDVLQIVKAKSIKELQSKCEQLTIEMASKTKFKPVMCTVFKGSYKITKLEPAKTEEKPVDNPF